MGRAVTVRGGLVAVDDLPTGAVATWELTPQVRRRIEQGYYVLVSPASLDELDDPEPADDPADDPEDERGEESPPETGELPVPAGNASKPEWLAFLESRGVEVPVNDEGETPGRDGLRTLWQQVSGGS